MVLLRRRRAYHVQRNQSGLGLYSARLVGGNKDDGAGMDSLLDVARHDLPIALQDQQSHIDAGGVDPDELARFQTGEHCS